MNHIGSIKFNLSPLELLKPGYSQELLMMIKEFELPFSTVKLDRSMLRGICEDQQVALLKEWGVDLIQGYY